MSPPTGSGGYRACWIDSDSKKSPPPLSPAIITTECWAPDTGSEAQYDHRSVSRRLNHAAATSSNARCLSEVSSNERCTWLVRVVYRRP